jgi:pyruvate dehydrogenase E2 component (dihydrolipoamide acetyltransferase)
MDVLMPQLGETVTEGKITRWFRSAGDQVAPGDNLFEIETDKVSMEVPSTTAGVLSQILVPAGEVAPVGAVVAVIGDGGAATASAAAPQAASQSPQPVARAAGESRRSAPAPARLDPFLEVRTPERNFGPARLAGGTKVSPLARRLAAERGIDLSSIVPSGPHGRILARDVEAAGQRAPTVPGSRSGAEAVKGLYRDTPFEEMPLDGMRRTLAERLTEAKQTIPHFYLTADIDIGRLLALREQANAAAAKDGEGNASFKLSINDLVVKAWALALQRVPAANAVWAQDRILRFRHSDIGVAVAIEGGLLTPVVRRAEARSLAAISAEIRELSARARARKLMPAEYQGGASTVSNLGMHGVREFAAIINPPHATILSVGAARRQAVEAEDGGIVFVSVMTVTLSCDHRVVDGALGAELLGAFKRLIEHPVTMLVT